MGNGTTRKCVAEERREQILEAALHVFSTKGYVEATNKDIAIEAGIASPGLIYHYFTDKTDLFNQVLDRYAPPMKFAADPSLFDDLSLPDALRQFGAAYLSIMDNPQLINVMRLIIGEALREPDNTAMVARIAPAKVAQPLANYLWGQMERGVVCRTDPLAAALCFLGPLFIRVFAGKLLGFTAISALEPEEFLNTHITLYLKGACL